MLIRRESLCFLSGYRSDHGSCSGVLYFHNREASQPQWTVDFLPKLMTRLCAGNMHRASWFQDYLGYPYCIALWLWVPLDASMNLPPGTDSGTMAFLSLHWHLYLDCNSVLSTSTKNYSKRGWTSRFLHLRWRSLQARTNHESSTHIIARWLGTEESYNTKLQLFKAISLLLAEGHILLDPSKVDFAS